MRFCLLAGFTSLSHLALAEDPAVNAATEPTAAKVKWSGNAELGFIRTNGNSDTESFNGKFKIVRNKKPLKTSLKLEALTSKESGDTSKEKYLSEVKADYSIAEKEYIASSLSYEDERFSGYEYKSVLSVGYGYRLWNTENGELDIELGPGYRRSSLEERNDKGEKVVSEAIGRFALNLTANLSENAIFTEEFTVEGSDSSVVYKSDMGLQSTLVGALAMKINYQVKYTDNVPEDTKNTDSTVGVTLVYGF